MSLNPVGVKKRLTRIKNKMKDFDVEFKEWWKLVEEYFAKELEKNMVQHKVDERILMQILFVEVQQVWKHWAKMRKLK